MLKGRAVTIKFDKPADPDPTEKKETPPFEDRTEVIIRAVERIGQELFVGICVYVLLDTRRKVLVARAKHSKI